MSRPEHRAPPEIVYNEDEAKKYASNSRMIEIQTQMSERALELLAIPPGESQYILDVGCGSGLSGAVLSEAGHVWVGLDISSAMIEVARERGTEGDMYLSDMGQGLPFRPGTFDAAISVSALQWLCNQDKTSHNPRKRMRVFFQSLYHCLKRGARAVFQLYPETPAQMELITNAAMRCGFMGGLVVDYPNSTKAKKMFLCLFAGVPPGGYELPKALGTEESGEPSTVTYERGEARQRARDARKGKKSRRAPVKSKDWILQKKERQRKQGKDVRAESKYTARKRRAAF
ncbi:Williams Beuren syndrome chromosome region 22 protein [Balamuthia mandrillaris]